MKNTILILITIAIFLILGSIGFGCGNENPVNTSNPVEVNIQDINERGGCILLEITFQDFTKSSYWITTYYKENEMLHLYNRFGYLISIDCNQIKYISEFNHCGNVNQKNK